MDGSDDPDDRRPQHDLAEAIRLTNHGVWMAIDGVAAASGRFHDRRWATVAELLGRSDELVNGWDRRQLAKAAGEDGRDG